MYTATIKSSASSSFISSSFSLPFNTTSSIPKLSMKNLRYSNPNLASLSGYSITTFATSPLLILFKSFNSPLLFSFYCASYFRYNLILPTLRLCVFLKSSDLVFKVLFLLFSGEFCIQNNGWF